MSEMSPTYQLVIGDARRMERIADGSVQLMVTSPPYWQLKDYEAKGQIGFHESYESYLESLREVWTECARVLEPGCRAVVNIGDQFARAEVYGRYRVIPIHAEIIRQFEDLELDFMGSIIWQKVTTCNSSGGGAVMGSFPHPRNGIIKLDYEHILVFKKQGKARSPTPEQKSRARMSKEEWGEYFYGHWTFSGARQKDHIATFPEELPRRLIRMFTFPDELVLDPFLGSGTTMKVARELERSCIGYEINPHFEEIIAGKTGFGAQRDILSSPEENLEVFHDLCEADERAFKESAERQRTPDGYGSVVRKGDSKYRETYYRVEKIVDPCRFVLDDRREIELIGLEARRDQLEGGVAYLRALLKGQRVYLRDGGKEDDRVYLHLKNRTCINARLIREGFADVDKKQEFRLKARYLRYQDERGE